uniref:Uncharacterized protein n=1 Tax=Hucho hucho TaxID=62062 RepID=A0A4W5Q9M2_9TELE
MKFRKLFGHAVSVVIGMIHVQDGLIIENMHDVPHSQLDQRCFCSKQLLLLHWLQVATYSIVVYFQCRDFIRAEGYVFSLVADEGLLNACSGDLLRYGNVIGCFMICGYVFVFLAPMPTSDVSIVETTTAAEFFLSDRLIITGTATGVQADPVELRGVGGVWANAVDPESVKKLMGKVHLLRK